MKDEKSAGRISEHRTVRAVPTAFQVREDEDGPIIEGYFAVFNSVYDMGWGMSESIAPGAFTQTLAGADVRALTNHDTSLVLGRTKAGTLELREDSRGLWGRVRINTQDRAAMDLYERVKRGDVDQCSFGFDIDSEETDYREDGSVHWTIKAVTLYEVSVCTFPAYEQTSIAARAAQRDEIRRRALAAWKDKMKARLNNGTESAAPAQAD